MKHCLSQTRKCTLQGKLQRADLQHTSFLFELPCLALYMHALVPQGSVPTPRLRQFRHPQRC